MAEEGRKQIVKKAGGRGKKRRGPEKPVTLADVDAFLDSPVARRYYAFSESNVKRKVIRMLVFLRDEVDRQTPAADRQEHAATPRRSPPWTQRVRKRG